MPKRLKNVLGEEQRALFCPREPAPCLQLGVPLLEQIVLPPVVAGAAGGKCCCGHPPGSVSRVSPSVCFRGNEGTGATSGSR